MEQNIFAKPIELISIDWKSELPGLIIDLEHLRRRHVRGSTPEDMFYEIKSIFHILESLGSARLEGNRTAMAEIIEENISPSDTPISEQQQEVRNIEDALQYIDGYITEGGEITDAFIRETHKKIVTGLTPSPKGEGDPTPGQYRTNPVTITGSKLRPPSGAELVKSNMASLVEFINQDTPSKDDLLKTALVHHRFTAIHPFNNGNGRTVRALTYAMLLQQEYSVNVANRILNPTAIFCNDRDQYNKMLAIADKGRNEDLLYWSEYVFRGLKDEIEKIDKLTDYLYVRENLLLPAIKDAVERKSINAEQEAVLRLAVNVRKPIVSGDIASIFPGFTPLKRSRLIRRMVELKLLKPTGDGKRSYVLSFSNSYLLRGVVDQLNIKGFIPGSLA